MPDNGTGAPRLSLATSAGARAKADPFDVLYDVVQKKTGLDLREYKQDQLRRRLITWADARGDRDLTVLAQRIATDPNQMRELFERVAINVSELYRNPERWAELQTKVIPGLLKRTASLRCWSAGCSFGAEAHTLATILEASGARYSIVGTDIDEDALATARAGRFDTGSMRGVPPKVRDRYFSKIGDEWQAGPEVRRNLRFRTGNLLQDRFEKDLDLILCRNVVIYFTDEAKDRLYRKFYDALKPGGILFVGGTERISDAKGMGYEAPLPFFYQKPLNETLRKGQEQASWRNAS